MSLMHLYTELDVVNDMLGLLGESPVSALDEDHPLVPPARSALRTTSTALQAREWWFNVEFPTLVPQTDGKIYVPNNTAAADSQTEYPRLSVRGTVLFNLDEGTDQFKASIKVRLHRVLDFAEVPISVRAHIAAKAKLKFVQAYDGDPTKIRLLMAEVQDTELEAQTESIRNARVNLMNRRGVALGMFRARGSASHLYNQGHRGNVE